MSIHEDLLVRCLTLGPRTRLDIDNQEWRSALLLDIFNLHAFDAACNRELLEMLHLLEQVAVFLPFGVKNGR